MRDRVTAALKRIASTFGSFSAGQKAVTIVAVVALAVGGYFFSVWVQAPTYAPLYSSLAASDAAAIVEQLNAEGVPYQLADGGNTILVPKEQVYDLRLTMSGQGLPADTDNGYSLLDKQNVMTSEFMQQVGYRRAMEGELAKTIKSMDDVRTATVHLAIPQENVFADEQKPPTASVLVATNKNKPLTGDQVQAVVHLVASSIEGLEPANVTVVGADGQVLSSGDSAQAGGGSSAAGDQRTRATTDYETRLGTSLTQLLDTVVGPGNAKAHVTADLDYDNTETKTEKYVADPNTPPLSEQTETERYIGNSNGGATGVLGPDNVQAPPGEQGSGVGNYDKTTETRNNAVGVVRETRRSAPGSVRKLSVAVVLNSDAIKGANEAQLQQIVSAALGLDPQRGDTIAVSAMQFDKTAAANAAKELQEAEKADATSALMQQIKTGAAIGGVLLLLLFAWISSRRRTKRLEKALQAEIARFEAEQAALSAGGGAQALGGGSGAAGELEAGPGGPSDDERLRAERQRDISSMVEQQPEEVAALLRGWLADRRS
ncbi:flagellar M-ring protein [Virgisporangium aliadipatigenens]|uniref:Flagellar M-ring protein n=1 Tax=Virgisporangium aliadipatigenens TaxID=741659 RepID=A0A8J4DU15_9ACTN|nr:flagellar basal-body MS-ring/collar protein FliF [Virgisporangium aliadipatigenens]GIJ50830.1 flagellar M-ring protein [Virgisporangium aliadipatigenens]